MEQPQKNRKTHTTLWQPNEQYMNKYETLLKTWKYENKWKTIWNDMNNKKIIKQQYENLRTTRWKNKNNKKHIWNHLKK